MHRERRSFQELFAETAPAIALNEEVAEMPAVLVVPASADELAAHASYLAGMSGDTPIWHSYTVAPAPAAVGQADEDDEAVEAERALAPC